MWVFTKHGFFSAVSRQGDGKPANPSILTASWYGPESKAISKP